MDVVEGRAGLEVGLRPLASRELVEVSSTKEERELRAVSQSRGAVPLARAVGLIVDLARIQDPAERQRRRGA